MNQGLGYTRDKTPQRAARHRANQLREWAHGLREYVEEGQVESWKTEKLSKTGKVLRKGGLRSRAITDQEGRKMIQEAERLELLAALTLEALGLKE